MEKSDSGREELIQEIAGQKKELPELEADANSGDQLEDMALSDIIDIGMIKSIMEKFYQLTGMTGAVLDLSGRVLVAIGWQDICMKFHRINPETKKNCLESDTILTQGVEAGTYKAYKCKNNLWDIVTPLFIDGKHVGNVFFGQFFYADEETDIDLFRQQANRYGFDQEEYLEALAKVPHFRREDVQIGIEFYANLAKVFSQLSVRNYQKTKMLEERNKALEIIEQKNMELRRSNKELEQFAYVASHDLQEPLRMVSSYTQLLERRYAEKLDQDAKDFIGFAVDGATRMQQLINDLLDYSRITTRGKEFKECDANLIVKQAIINLQMSIEESKAVISCDPLPRVKADSSQLERIFQNMIENAIKFKSSKTPKIKIGVSDNGNEWIFAIKDNGIGIEDSYKDRIFVIFQRLHSRKDHPGTGIGLAICKRAVQRHNGRIWFESKMGEGSTFYFSLPK